MSGIYIPGMEMPIGGCVNCVFCVYDRCLINLKLEKKASVTHGCPLVPVPDHGRLIDADELYNDINESVLLTDGFKDTFNLWFDEQPVVIPASMGYKMKHYSCCPEEGEG